MYNSKLALGALKKINVAAKQAGREKQAAYDSGNHDATREYKMLQKRLYTLKGLSLIEMVRQGIVVHSDTRSYDADHNTYLETFISNVPDMDNTYHSISLNQTASENEKVNIYSRVLRAPSSNVYFQPYVTYLIDGLSHDLRAIYDTLDEEMFSSSDTERIKSLLEALYENGFYFQTRDISGYSYTDIVQVTAYFDQAKIFDLNIISRFQDYTTWDEDGRLFFGIYDSYDDYDDYDQ